jgi:hypothetical protein
MAETVANPSYCVTEVTVSIAGKGRRVEVINGDDIEFYLTDKCYRTVAGLAMKFIRAERERFEAVEEAIC